MSRRGSCTSDRDTESTNQTTVTLTFPAGTSAGDVIDCVFTINSGSATVTAAAGANTWTITQGPVYQSANTAFARFIRRLDAIDVANGSVTATWSAGGRCQGSGNVFTGGLGTWQTPPTPVQAAAASVTAPTVTTVGVASDISILGVCRVVSGTIAVINFGTGFTTDVTNATNFSTAGVNESSAAGHRTAAVGSGVSVGGQSVTSGGLAAQLIVGIVELDPVPSAPPVLQPGRTWLRRFKHSQQAPAVNPPNTTPVEQGLSTTWDTLAPVTATRATTWTAAAQAQQTKATTWNTLAPVSQTKATTWTALGSVTQTKATTWAVAAPVTATRATTWTVRASVTGTRATSWNVAGPVTASRATTWNVASQVSQTKTTTWTVRTSVSATRATSWAALASIATTRAISWTVQTTVTQTRSTTWAVNATIAGAKSTSWAVLAAVADTRATTWNVAPPRPPRDITLTSTLEGPDVTSRLNPGTVTAVLDRPSTGATLEDE